jgi:glutaredoxin 3
MVIVYSKSSCTHCVQAKKLLESYSIVYTDINIEDDMIAKEFLISEGHRSVPQLYVGDNLLVDGGFDGLSKMPKNLIKSVVNEMEGV